MDFKRNKDKLPPVSYRYEWEKWSSNEGNVVNSVAVVNTDNHALADVDVLETTVANVAPVPSRGLEILVKDQAIEVKSDCLVGGWNRDHL